LSRAEEHGVENASTMRKQELMFATLKQLAAQDIDITGVGVVEVLQDGFGFLRSPDANYLPGQTTSTSVRRRSALRTSHRRHRRGPDPQPEGWRTLLRIAEGRPRSTSRIRTARHKVHFDNLTPLYPTEWLKLDGIEDPTIKDLSPRVIDIVAPIGKGQRALIVAPPRTGKTMILQNVAHSISTNHPECYVIVLLIDERPEEVTDMQRSVKGEVISSTFDEPAVAPRAGLGDGDRKGQAPRRAQARRCHPARFDHATRSCVQHGCAVLRQGPDRRRRFECAATTESGFFGAARNIEEGGSLTIIATALIDTGSRMDEVIFEEFKGTGNSEIVLDRKVADKRSLSGDRHRQVRNA
jgi:transcription termination factor Rho